MARLATSWTGAAVNGLMVFVLLAWLADNTTRSPVPEHAATTPAPDHDAEPPGRPIKTSASIDLPPPPRPTSAESRHDGGTSGVAHPASPMRPATDRESERSNEIVALRAVGAEPRPVNRPVPAPLRPVEESELASDPDVPSTETEVEVGAEAVRTGRQLLRIFEHGDGPEIEIAWPGSSAERERLHGVLRRCFGMRLALIDQAGGLYLDAGPRGRRWPIDLDRFSAFVRRTNGRITSAERRDADRVARYHHRLPATDSVRLFPRAADAALLGGLAHLLGGDYRAAKAITASYRLRGLRVTVGDLRIDGRRVAGRIDLSRGASAACRGTG